MFHNILICPYSDYRNESVRRCNDPNQYHCLQNEHKQQGWLCIDPIWIEEDRCPEFNSRAQKLDSRVCKGRGCPGGIFRSNHVYKYPACHANSYNSTRVYTEPETSTLKTEETTTAGASDIPLYVGTAAGVIVLFLLVCFAVFKRRKKQQKNREKDEEMKLLDVNEKPTNMYLKAKQFLYKDRFVVLVGTQGAGKTLMSYKLKKEWFGQCVNDDKRTSADIVKVDSVNISKITKRTGTTDRTLFMMDGVLKDLNTEMFVDFVIEELNSWHNVFNTSRTFYIVITVTHMLWQTFKKKFKKCKFFQRNIVDLGDINKEDRINILDYYIHQRTQSVVTRSSVEEGTDVTCMSQNIREVVTEERKYNIIGYPAIIGVMCKNDRLLADPRRFVRTPPSWIRNDLNAIVNSDQTDGYKCLVLSYMAVCDGSINLQRLDESLLQEIATLLNVQYTSPDDLMFALTSLEKEYIKKAKETYVFENNVVHRFVFAIIGEKWKDFVTENCSTGMLLDWTCIEEEFPPSFELDRRKLYFKQPDLSVLSRRYAALPEEEIKFNHNLKNMNFKEMLENERSKKTSTQNDE